MSKTNGRKRSAEEAIEPEGAAKQAKTGPGIRITDALCNWSSGQDVKPFGREEGDYVFLMCGDGHGGDACAKTISSNAEQICSHVLGLAPDNMRYAAEAGMQMCDDLCRDHPIQDGAMLIIVLFHKATRRLLICSRGDSSCTVYQDINYFQQPWHDVDTVKCNDQWRQACETKEITVSPDFGWGFEVDINGCIYAEKKRLRFLHAWKETREGSPVKILQDQARSLAFPAASFVGHSGLRRLPSCVTTFTMPPGAFHVILTSDGVSDVMHALDPMMRKHGVNADDILKEAKRRWTTATTATCNVLHENDKYNKFGPQVPMKQFKWSNSDVKNVWRDGKLVEYNQGADDISAIVMEVSD